ncbi:MAG: C25 family cysteine peptidase, partial [candidate division WOR-3 bacterium]
MRIAVLASVILGLALGASPVVWMGNSDGGSLTIRPEPLEVRRKDMNGRPFVHVDIAGAGVWGEYGMPAVPWFRQLVEVPFGAQVTVAVELDRVDTLMPEVPLAPRQEPVPKSGPVPEFRYDAKAYAKDSFFPQIGARLTELVEVRGHRIAVIDIFPVAYNPGRNLLVTTRELKVRVSWTGADWGATHATHRRYASPPFAGRLDRVVVNAEDFALDNGPSLPIGYLVIVPDAWEPSIRPLAEWRRRKGFSVFVRSLSQVGGSSASAVKAYIQNAYDNWPIPPSFVLLVGDVDRINCFTGSGQGSPPTDLNFGCVAGTDYLPDIDVSRLSVANQAQLDSFISNVVRYEQGDCPSGTGWLQRAYFIASADGGNHQIAERTHAYVMSRLRPKGVVCDSLWLYYGTGTPIVSAVNSGRAWVTYSGHGSENAWVDPSPDFDVGAVHGLANVDLIP